METKAWLYKGAKQLYRATGKGPLVVLVHGFGEDGAVWKNQFASFPNYQLVVPDLPGSGGSQAVEDMSMEGLANVLHALVKTELQHESCILIGHSMGGYATLAFAEKYPEAVNAFGLFHSTAFADSEQKRETRRKGLAFMKEHGAAPFLKTVIPNLYAPATRSERPELVEAQAATADNFSTDALVAYYEAMLARPDRTQVLRDTKRPVLFVLGKWDSAVPEEEGWKQCHLPETAYIELFDRSGHTGMAEESEKANQVLTAFIETVENLA